LFSSWRFNLSGSTVCVRGNSPWSQLPINLQHARVKLLWY
jgi:hypothetical protein